MPGAKDLFAGVDSPQEREQSFREKWLYRLLAVMCIAFFVYHMWNVVEILQDSSIQHLNTHMAGALLVFFLATAQRAQSKKSVILAFIMLTLSVIVTAYIHFSYDELSTRGYWGIYTNTDAIMSIIMIILCFEVARRAFGNVLPIVVGIVMLYNFFGYLIPGDLGARHLSFEKTVTGFVTNFDGGMYGSGLLNVSAVYLALFFIFASLIETSGAVDFFKGIGKLVGRKVRSGPGLTSVTTSGLVGMISGSPGTDVAITGSFTIPSMKSQGYKAHQAAAIEAISSVGGSIMPPVMGAAAFVMAAISGIPYIDIVTACIIPAILYYLSVAVYVILRSNMLGLEVEAQPVSKEEKRNILLSAPQFLIPIGVLVYLLMQDKSAQYSVFYSTITLIGISLIRKENRSLQIWIDGIVKGVTRAAAIAVVLALLSFSYHTLASTGLAVELGLRLVDWSGGSLYLALLMVFFAALLIGCGLPSVAVYLLVAIIMVPTLTTMGVTKLQAHLFPFFYGVFSNITLPVAGAVVIASGMAGASFLKSGWETMRAGLGGLAMPWMVVFAPVLVLKSTDGGALYATMDMIACITLVIALQIAIWGQYLARLTWAERGPMILSIVLLFFHVFESEPVAFVFGISIFIAVTVEQFIKRQRRKRQIALIADNSTI